MGSTKDSFFEELRGATLGIIIQFVLGLIFSSTTFAFLAHIAVLNIDPLRPYGWYLGVMSGTGGAWVFFVVFRRRNRFRPRYPRLHADFRLLAKTITYAYHSLTSMTYRKLVKLRALRDGLDSYRDKYHWTGTGAQNVVSAVSGHQYRPAGQKNVWQYYEVHFNRSLQKNEEIESELVWTLDDGGGTAVPFCSATIDEPRAGFITCPAP